MKELLQILKTLPPDTTVCIGRSLTTGEDSQGATVIQIVRSLPDGTKIERRELYTDTLLASLAFPIEVVFKDQLNSIEKEYGKLTAH